MPHNQTNERGTEGGSARMNAATWGMGTHVLMSCAGHHVEFRCCGVVHYESIEPILVGARIQPENLRRLCAGCPDGVEGAAIRCCICRKESPRSWSVAAAPRVSSARTTAAGPDTIHGR